MTRESLESPWLWERLLLWSVPVCYTRKVPWIEGLKFFHGSNTTAAQLPSATSLDHHGTRLLYRELASFCSSLPSVCLGTDLDFDPDSAQLLRPWTQHLPHPRPLTRSKINSPIITALLLLSLTTKPYP